jgi:hypothetical protein
MKKDLQSKSARQLRRFHLLIHLSHSSQRAQSRALLPSDHVAHVIAREDDWPIRLDERLVTRIDLHACRGLACLPR